MRRTRNPHARRNPVSRPTFRPRLDILEGREAPGATIEAFLGLSLLGPGLNLLDGSVLGNDTPALAGPDNGPIDLYVTEGEPAVHEPLGLPTTFPAQGTSDLDNGSFLVNFGTPDAQADLGELDPLTQDLLLADTTGLGRPRVEGLTQPSPNGGGGGVNSTPVNTVSAGGNAGSGGVLNTPRGNFGVAPPRITNESGGEGGPAGTSNPADAGGAAPSGGGVARSEAPPPAGDAEAEQIRALLRTGNAYVPGEPGAEEELERKVQEILRSRNLSNDGGGDSGVRDVPAFSSGPGGADPGAPGPITDITVQDYDFGNTAVDPVSITGTGRVELTARIWAPTDLSAGPRPVLVFMHGNHNAIYNPTTGGVAFSWPPAAPFQSLPNHMGYGSGPWPSAPGSASAGPTYVGDLLASHGYIVISISANGVNVLGGTNMVPRAELMHRHLEILRDLNTGDGTVTAEPGETLAGDLSPFDTRFVGKLDLANIGTMGHSRGGDGVVAHYQYETGVNLGSGLPVLPEAERFPIKAVLPLAPVDFAARTINNVPLLVMHPYNDGDVSDLQGQRFYDRSRYNLAGDTAPHHVVTVFGAGHNAYNTIWWAEPAARFAPGAGAAISGAPQLTPQEQRSTAMPYFGAFFRTYVGNSVVPAQQFVRFLTGDAPVPPSVITPASPVLAGGIFHQFHPADTATSRRDVNRLLNTAALTTNQLGGAVTSSGVTTAFSTAGLQTVGSASLTWTTSGGFWQNAIPAGPSADVASYSHLQFRVSNQSTTLQNFSVVLTDGAGNSASTTVNQHYTDPDPARRTPLYVRTTITPTRSVMNTAAIPLSAFGGVNLADVRSIRFVFDQTSSGSVLVNDLMFANRADTSAGPFVVSITDRIVPGSTSVAVQFGGAVNPDTFQASDVKFVAPDGTTFAATGVTPVPGSGNSQFNVNFPAVSQLGSYLVNIGPDVQDAAGNPMDQDFDGTAGEPVHDVFDSRFQVVGLVDDGDAGFATTGLDWTSFPDQGFANDVTFSNPGTGADQATWTFTGLPAGQYRVALTWSIHPNRATNAPFAVFDGTTAGTQRGSFTANQEILPNDFLVAGTAFEYLPGSFLINSGTLTVRLTDQANEFVIADAVIVERVPFTPQVVDDGDAGYGATAGFIPWTLGDQGFQADVQYAAAGGGGESAFWQFTGLTPGTYVLSATWSEHPNRATDATYSLLDDATVEGAAVVDQEQAPNDFIEFGVGWKVLGTLNVDSSTASVVLSDLANEFVIADAVRLDRA